jgi:hypothetical protein
MICHVLHTAIHESKYEINGSKSISVDFINIDKMKIVFYYIISYAKEKEGLKG